MNSSAVLVSLCVIRIEICDSELEETASELINVSFVSRSQDVDQLLINKSFYVYRYDCIVYNLEYLYKDPTMLQYLLYSANE